MWNVFISFDMHNDMIDFRHLNNWRLHPQIYIVRKFEDRLYLFFNHDWKRNNCQTETITMFLLKRSNHGSCKKFLWYTRLLFKTHRKTLKDDLELLKIQLSIKLVRKPEINCLFIWIDWCLSTILCIQKRLRWGRPLELQ